jgi:DNA-binding PadR family transcriptional regulator
MGDNMTKETFLGEFEQMLLLAILRLGARAYGATLMQELEATAGRRVSRGAVYVTMDRMEEKGWIESRPSDPRPERGGRPRRLVRVTLEGVAELRRSREALLRLWDGLEELLEAP